MAIFAVVVTEVEAFGSMEAAITKNFLQPDYMFLGSGTWLVDAPLLTTREVTNCLRGGELINEFQIRSFIVLPMNSYFGMHAQIVWEWLAAKGA